MSGGGVEPGGGGVTKIIDDLHKHCSAAVIVSSDSKFDQINGASYGLAIDLDLWSKVLTGRPEHALYVAASNEFVMATLNNFQGQYRNAFKGLRLVLELVLQGVYLSVNLVLLAEWLSSQADTSWAAIKDDDNGVFSKRFSRAFFPELRDDVGQFKSLAETLFREMSECTHGNVPNRIPLPQKIEFDEPTFALWHSKAGTLRYVLNFCLTLRYMRGLSSDNQAEIARNISDQLNHIEPIRQVFGGPVT